MQALAGPPEAVTAVLLDPDFVADRAGLPKLGDARLLESTRDGDRAVQRIRLRFTAPLAPAVTKVIDPDRLTWVDEADYDLVAHTAEHVIVPDHYADRLACSYRTTVQTHAQGARRRLTGEVRVRMPLVGGRVERAVVSGLAEHASAEAELINAWLTR